ncbi:MAG: ribosomal protein S18 acetylase RimI-like enzyme [Paraglaciecola sp.]|jgi:ribosomal protein S18 acetylase RimI-like enzyme
MTSRQAEKADAHTLAELIFCSAPVALAATFDINDELSAINFLRSSLLTPDGQYGYANHWVTEIDNQVVASLCPWHSDLTDLFHQATLTQLTGFYGIAHAISVVQASQALQDCIPKPEKHEWCIGHFAVLAEYQNQGIGSALLRLMHKQAITSGKLALSLDVDAGNTQAIDFYLRQGFVKKKESGVSQRMYALGIGSHLHLSKAL